MIEWKILFLLQVLGSTNQLPLLRTSPLPHFLLLLNYIKPEMLLYGLFKLVEIKSFFAQDFVLVLGNPCV